MNLIAATLLLAVVPYAIVATLTSQKYDRYILPLFPFLAIACGVFLAEAVGWFGSRVHSTRWVLPAGVAVTALLAGSTLSQAPYAISYVDPLVGGQARARRNILLGWGEGLEVLGAEVRHREGKRCDDTRILGAAFYVVAFPCGRLFSVTSIADVHNADYFVTYVSGQQRSSPFDQELLNSVRRSGDLVKNVRIDGLDYAQLWKIRPVT